MSDVDVDLNNTFALEPHGPDTFVGESPPYPWGRIYGGLVIAQGLWAATLTVTVVLTRAARARMESADATPSP